MMKPSDRNRIATILGIIAAIGCVGTALAGDDAPTSSAPLSPDGPPRAQIDELQGDQTRNFAIFQRARTSQDVMPSDVRALLGETDITGKNVDLARRVPTPDGDAWAIPGNGAVCLALPDPHDTLGLTCAPTDVAMARGEVAMIVAGSEPRVLLGVIVPEGMSVAAAFDDGRSEALQAVDGVVVAVLHDARSITLTTARGETTHHDIPIPPPAPAGPA